MWAWDVLCADGAIRTSLKERVNARTRRSILDALVELVEQAGRDARLGGPRLGGGGGGGRQLPPDLLQRDEHAAALHRRLQRALFLVRLLERAVLAQKLLCGIESLVPVQ